MVDTLDARIHKLELGLRRIARHQAGCQALMTQYGVGELIALVTLTELGDVTRMSSSRKTVRFAGIDISVHRSDRSARVGKLTREGSPTLRWALYEAAQSATRPASPDYQDYHALKAPRADPHPGVTHDRPQDRQTQSPPPPPARTRRPRTDRRLDHRATAPTAPHQTMASSVQPAPQLLWHPPLVATLTKTERLESTPPTTNQPSRHRPPSPGGLVHQITPGAHGATQPHLIVE